MIHSTQGIVLSHIKYKETSIIVNIYTRKFGRQSYVVNNVRSKRNRSGAVLLQAMTLLDMEVYHRPKADLQRIKDFRVVNPLTNIPFKQDKRAMAFFLTELMSKVLREEEENTDLFNFIDQSISVFDTIKSGTANFHLFFLFQLTRFLGFAPGFEKPQEPYFDLLNGCFCDNEPTHGFFIEGADLNAWRQLYRLRIDALDALCISGEARYSLLNKLLEYYRLHIDTLGDLKSLPIVHQLFHLP
ncbi:MULTISPECIES: DNA repair protein RecO [unclassified Carboxylicivirga]|uniref:DNA repair protein RecO n=1 Tax=Carboxylicivirga TaxID=1628153 RepID=UPI003D341D0C